MGKGKHQKKLKLVGRHINDLNQSDYIIRKALDLAKGIGENEYNKFEYINGIQTSCSIMKLEVDGHINGSVLKIEDISNIHRATLERDKAIEKLSQVEKALEDEQSIDRVFSSFVGDSSAIKFVKKMALKSTRTNSNVLILGESGTGKTVLARLIHENSKNKNGKFVEVNCAAIPENLLESELFGYLDGAFTGAKNKGKLGLFKVADKGTIFLDEIGDMPLNTQVKLLQVIQNGIFYPLGSTKPEKVNARIITATNKNLENEILNGHFREDLYYRINVFPIYIPPLRDRKEDIYNLIDLMLPKICDKNGLRDIDISPEAKNKLLLYDWPGNVRELENILERAINLTENSLIISDDINLDISTKMDMSLKTFKEHIESEEKNIIKHTLNICNGNSNKAMEILDMSRSNFYKKVKEYDIRPVTKYI